MAKSWHFAFLKIKMQEICRFEALGSNPALPTKSPNLRLGLFL